MKTYIVDDELDSRRTIALFLKDGYPDLSIAGEAATIEEALLFLRSNKIDLLFLDIQLRNGTGFQILESLEAVDFEVIFVTAYDRFAIRAIKSNALDYILKPIDQDEFNQAVEKAITKGRESKSPNIDALLRSVHGVLQPVKLNLPTQHGFKIVSLEQIVRCEADDSYTKFFWEDGTSILVSKTMKTFESILLNNAFVRIHNSHIVNVEFIREYVKGRGGQVILADGNRLSVSNTRKAGLLKILNSEK